MGARYSVMGASSSQVKNIGGVDLKEARATGIIFATLTEEQASKLRSQGCTVSKVGGVKAGVMPPVVTPPIPIAAIPTYLPAELGWAIGLEEMRGITDPPLYGEGINVAIIGTGIRETHQRINGRVIYRKNFTTDLMGDGFNHDTGIADIIITMAPLCNVLNIKVLNNKGEGSEENVVLAIDDCISLHDTNPGIAPTVINLSLGSLDDGNPNNSMRVVCRAAIDKGIFIFSSAGNSGPTPYSITCPACEQYVFAVGSCSYEPFAVSYFSSRGPTIEGLIKPDGVLFGENIVMASSESDTAVIAKSGTSFATPFGSALAVLYHEGALRQAVWRAAVLGVPAAEIYYVPVSRMIDEYLSRISLKPEGVPLGKDYDYGYGLPYGPLALKVLTAAPAVDISTIMQPIVGIAMLGMLGMMIAPEKRK